jgi:hypothetical protein
MSEKRAGREAAKWVAVAVVVPVLYLLSIGPAMWVFGKTGWNHPDWRAKAAEALYLPVAYIAKATGSEGQLSRYIGLFVTDP